MFQARQINLMLGTAKDYQNGLVSLGRLIDVIEGIVAVLDDRSLSILLDEERSDLEQIHAQVCIGTYDFEKNGRSIVDQAVKQVIAKAEVYLASLPQDDEESTRKG